MNAQHKTDYRRNALIAKIHVAKKQMALNDCNYQALLIGATGKESCSDMNIAELDNVVKAFERYGFKAKPKRKLQSNKKVANAPQARKIRAFWLMLHHLGAVDDASEDSLEMFVKRTCGVDALNWLQERQADTVIRALRGWLTRVGYYHPDAQTCSLFGNDGLAENISLINTQCGMLDIRDVYKWISAQGFGEYVSLQQIDRDDLHQIIKVLGNKIRSQKARNV